MHIAPCGFKNPVWTQTCTDSDRKTHRDLYRQWQKNTQRLVQTVTEKHTETWGGWVLWMQDIALLLFLFSITTLPVLFPTCFPGSPPTFCSPSLHGDDWWLQWHCGLFFWSNKCCCWWWHGWWYRILKLCACEVRADITCSDHLFWDLGCYWLAQEILWVCVW